ncbi:S-layer homology domain-containing protein [Patescibacteria group bacterium]
MNKFIVSLLVLAISIPVALAYSDVSNNTAIDYITDAGIVEGYEDGTYRPANPINRAEFTKILIEAKTGENPTDSAAACFNDFSIEQWFSSYVCYAKDEGIISGYPDGSFGPANNIKLTEAAKILVNVFEISKVDPVGDDWYSEFTETLISEKYIPDTFSNVGDDVTRGQMAEMIWRIMEEKHDQPALTEFDPEPCQPLGEDLPANIDMDQVRAEWLEWYNTERRSLGLHEYTYNDQLNRTATQWSKTSRDRGYMDHKRDGTTDYYDYYGIMAWFSDLGLEFEDGMYSENIAWEYYNCDVNATDCTQEFTDAVKKGFNFFIEEKGTDYTAHYDSMVSSNYNIIGFGAAADDDENKYYLTVHYAKAISNEPMKICD